MWAVVVPTAISQAPPWLGLSGNPSDSVVAPGTDELRNGVPSTIDVSCEGGVSSTLPPGVS